MIRRLELARTGVWERIADVRARTGMTVLLTTHYMEEAQEYCDRIALMHRGKIRAEGTPEELVAGVGGGSLGRRVPHLHRPRPAGGRLP